MSASPATRNHERCPDFAVLLRTGTPGASVQEQVAECFYLEMSRLARARCRDDGVAGDVAQQAMMAGLKGLSGFHGDAPLEHWLRRLVVRACARLRRGRKNDPTLHLPLEDAPTPAVVDEGLEVRLLLDERLLILRRLLDGLKEPDRSLLLLHEGQAVPLQELAARFDLTVDAVKSRLKRTRRELRAQLLAVAEGP